MSERIKQIKDKLIEFWNKYTVKQKVIVFSLVGVIAIALVVVSYIVTRPTYVQLARVEDAKSANQIIEALDENQIDYRYESRDNYTTIEVVEESLSEATLLIGSNDALSSGMTWSEALDNDMSTTTAEKRTKTTLALQTTLRKALKQYEGVQDAEVLISVPKEDYTVLAENQQTSVAVTLTLDPEKGVDTGAANAMALFLANAVGDSNTDNIVIVDTVGNKLFSGMDDSGLGGNIESAAEYKLKLSNQIANDVETVLLKCGYDDVEIGSSNIVFNMDKVTELYTEYSVAEGMEQGYYSHTYNYKSIGNQSSGGIPGTDSNDDDTDTMIQTSGDSNTQVTLDKADYLPNERQTNSEFEVGAVKPAESSMAVVLTKYNIIHEEALEEQGLLEEISFEEYCEQNSEKTPLEVDENIVELVRQTTGIAAANIQISAYTQSMFQAKEPAEPVSVQNILMIVLAILIVGLLVFVIFKGTAPVEVTELEPELSVEQLLATTKENQSLDDIEFSDKSEARTMIEKFVDEKPEAVAQLLRNWLNEDWG